jgi:hypothetical protein
MTAFLPIGAATAATTEKPVVSTAAPSHLMHCVF